MYTKVYTKCENFCILSVDKLWRKGSLFFLFFYPPYPQENSFYGTILFTHPMILFLYGADTFRSRQQMNKMIAKFKADRDQSGLNVSISDVSQGEPDKILEEIQAAPFLAEKRLVALKGLLSSKEKKLQEVFLEKMQKNDFPASTILLLWEEEGDFKKATNTVKELFSLLQKEKYAQRFDVLTGARLIKFIEEQVEEKGRKINREALVHLANNSRDDLWFVGSTLKQLLALCAGRAITLEDVKQFVPERFDDNIFNLIDAIVAGSGEKVFFMLGEQYQKGEDATFVFSMLIRQFRILLMLRDLLDRGLPVIDGVAKEMGLHPFVIKKSLPFAKKYSTTALQEIYFSLLEIDKKIKTGGGDQKMLLDLFIGRLCVDL